MAAKIEVPANVDGVSLVPADLLQVAGAREKNSGGQDVTKPDEPTWIVFRGVVNKGETAWIAKCPKSADPVVKAQLGYAERWFRPEDILHVERHPESGVVIMCCKKSVFAKRGMLKADGSLIDPGK